MAFLPQDYEAPRAAGSYMKLQDGENKVRILSNPILGWEEWINNKPVRYSYPEKPDCWANPDRPGKHFWAFVVWNYMENKIQVLQISQATIRKKLEAIDKDPDMGSVFDCDIKIKREGKDLLTKYDVFLLSAKPVEENIKEAYRATPCYLEALYTGNDPFGDWDTYTPAIFDNPPNSEKRVDIADHIKSDVRENRTDECVTIEQLEEISDLIGDDDEYREKVLKGVQKTFGVEKLAQLPANKYEAVLKSVKLHVKERGSKADNSDNVPF